MLALHAGPIEFATLPFANVGDLLRQVPLPVPAMLGHSDAARHPGAAGPRRRHAAGASRRGDAIRACRALSARPSRSSSCCNGGARSSLRCGGHGGATAGYLPYGIAFDVEKLTWELDFFVRHFVEAYRGISVPASQREALAEEWSAIASELAAEPRVLCHRDYHSRNLMLHDGSLYIIDFQDARMGPDTYDLASLLRDSYVDITRPQARRSDCLFLALKGCEPESALPARAIVARFPEALRSDGAAAQPQSARHFRVSDDHARQSGLHSVHAAHAALRADQPREIPAASRACASCSRVTSRSCGKKHKRHRGHDGHQGTAPVLAT